MANSLAMTDLVESFGKGCTGSGSSVVVITTRPPLSDFDDGLGDIAKENGNINSWFVNFHKNVQILKRIRATPFFWRLQHLAESTMKPSIL